MAGRWPAAARTKCSSCGGGRELVAAVTATVASGDLRLAVALLSAAAAATCGSSSWETVDADVWC